MWHVDNSSSKIEQSSNFNDQETSLEPIEFDDDHRPSLTNHWTDTVKHSISTVVLTNHNDQPLRNPKEIQSTDFDDVSSSNRNPIEKNSVEKEMRSASNATRHASSMITIYGDSSSDNDDVIEIHQFSLDDLDAYLDIYFDVLDRRLRYLIGSDDEIDRFRQSMKNRISSNLNSPEYERVILGKMYGSVVAAALLKFPGDPTSIPADRFSVKSKFCFNSLHFWLMTKSTYLPQKAEECYIEMIGVKENFRNLGIGTVMLESIEDLARQAHITLITTHVHNERLENYFERSNFHYDKSDRSAFWKWIIERDNFKKFSKTISFDP